MKQQTKYFVFLGGVLVLSIPFYYWGYAHPVAGLPFGLPISFLMIFVPFTLALIVAWREKKLAGVTHVFKRILDFQNVRLWPLVFAVLCMPLVVGLSYLSLKLLSVIPDNVVFSYSQLPFMMILYFLGAIPEEVGWTLTLTEPLTKSYDAIKAGILIGSVWAIWHVIPWNWAYSTVDVVGLAVLTILMRIGMVHSYMAGGKSLFLALLFHMQINVCTTFFGPAFNPWLASIWMLIINVVVIAIIRFGNPSALRRQAARQTPVIPQ